MPTTHGGAGTEGGSVPFSATPSRQAASCCCRCRPAKAPMDAGGRLIRGKLAAAGWQQQGWQQRHVCTPTHLLQLLQGQAPLLSHDAVGQAGMQQPRVASCLSNKLQSKAGRVHLGEGRGGGGQGEHSWRRHGYLPFHWLPGALGCKAHLCPRWQRLPTHPASQPPSHPATHPATHLLNVLLARAGLHQGGDGLLLGGVCGQGRAGGCTALAGRRGQALWGLHGHGPAAGYTQQQRCSGRRGRQ